MADKNDVTSWSEDQADNTDIGGVPLGENVMLPSNVNNALRTMMAQLKAFFKSTVFRIWDGTDPTKKLALDLSGQTTALTRTQKTPNYNGTLSSQALGSAIASATTTDIGAASGSIVHVTGTTTITGLGTADAGIEKSVIFDGILTLTHDGTSLALPGAANITTAAGDTATFISEGAGNWRCIVYQRYAYAPPTSAAAIVTPWVKYTPTYTGFGTPPVSRVWSRRVGDSLEIRGNFALGTPSSTEARMSLGFNGVDGGITVDATKVEQVQAAGHVMTSTPSSTGVFTVLVNGEQSYINFGYNASSAGGLAAVNGTSVGTNSEQVSFNAVIPVTGW